MITKTLRFKRKVLHFQRSNGNSLIVQYVDQRHQGYDYADIRNSCASIKLANSPPCGYTRPKAHSSFDRIHTSEV